MNENKFDGMGKIYSQSRPSYPNDFINYLYSNIGINKNSVIADIGSGTGKLTAQLAERESTVYAVEPNKDMRKTAEENLAEFKNVISINGTAENTGLNNASVDFITVAQAFHWFDRQKFKIECHRILKTGGKVILVWNIRDVASALVDENEKLNKKYCANFKGFSNGMHIGANEDDFCDFFTQGCNIKTFDNPILFNESGFIERNLSSSYAPKINDENYEKYIDGLKALFNKYSDNGVLTMPNKTIAFIGKI